MFCLPFWSSKIERCLISVDAPYVPFPVSEINFKRVYWSDECSIDLSESIRGNEYGLVAPCTCTRNPNVPFVCQCDNRNRPRNQKVKHGEKLMVSEAIIDRMYRSKVYGHVSNLVLSTILRFGLLLILKERQSGTCVLRMVKLMQQNILK